MRAVVCLIFALSWLFLSSAPASAEDVGGAVLDTITDSRLREATAEVLESDRYLHQSRLKRGMAAYGRTVLAGDEITRFGVEIVSVIPNGSAPQRDVILARLKDPRLQETSIIAGMSGSPVYVEVDGTPRLIGAVAYGASLQRDTSNGPLCGIQPIAQMLAAMNEAEHASDEPVASDGGNGQRDAGPARLTPEWKAMYFQRRAEFPQYIPSLFTTPAGSDASAAGVGWAPLPVPLTLAGCSDRALRAARTHWTDTALVAVPGGGRSGMDQEELNAIHLAPGSAVAVPFIRGDMEASAVGTVTWVDGDKVLAFGHPLLGQGPVRLPVATAYVHTVMASLSRSYKIAGAIRNVGRLVNDQGAAIAAVLNDAPGMVPVTVELEWPYIGQGQVFQFEVVRDRRFTPYWAGMAVLNSVDGIRTLPPEHSITYEVEIDFGPLGRYTTDNAASGEDIMPLLGDVAAPISAMLNNPFGVARVEQVRVKARLSDEDRRVMLLSVRLDRTTYRPGELVRAEVLMQRYKGPRFTRTIEVDLPDELPDGRYGLQIGGAELVMAAMQQQNPRLFDPRTLEELLDAMRRLASVRSDRLYGILDLGRPSVSVGRAALKDVPPTVASVLQQASPLEVNRTTNMVRTDLDLGLVLRGSERVHVVVDRDAPRP